MVRTRIAPSPTGYPHIGTIYQALFDFAFSCKHQGKFIVRIEDTDRERFVADAEEKIYQALDWFGIVEDESPRKGGPYGPYRQSERLDIYQKYADELIGKRSAYYCFCTRERLEEMRKIMQLQGKPPMYDKHCRNLSTEEVQKKITDGQKYVIRLKVPENTTIKVKDELRGEVDFNSDLVDDQVLLKADGFPTYHLAVVVDDHLMEITHVVRGEEWLSSAPKHVLLYDFFGWQKPQFIHTPVLRNPDKSKFSKRQGHTNVSWYQEKGYLPEAILNYLALMGWSDPEEKEIFSLNEFIKNVELNKLSPVGPIFDLQKLEWMNGVYIRRTEDQKLAALIRKFYRAPEITNLEKVLPLVKDRMRKLSDWEELTQFFYTPPEQYEEEADKKILKEVVSIMENCVWEKEKMEKQLRDLAEKIQVKAGDVFMTVRNAITGKKATPPILETMIVLGKKESMERFRRALNYKYSSGQ